MKPLMTRATRCLLLCALLLAGGRAAADDTPGRFDYWVLALSWSPQFCVSNAGDPQCTRPYDFVVHGLWPQHESGYPEFCGRAERLDRALVERMLPLMPSDKLVQHQWRRHGTCSGLTPDEYFLTVERARRAIAIPPAFVAPEKYLTTTPQDLERAFIIENERLAGEHLALQCSGRWLREVRICFDKEFRFRACGAELADQCPAEMVLRNHRGLQRRRGERE